MTSKITSPDLHSNGASDPSEPTDFDVLVVGAGISGIGAGAHLKSTRPDTTFAILEGRDTIGGTWSLFSFPGIRSDSDMPTFAFDFKPWKSRSILADGHDILDYLGETVAQYELADHIRFGYRVTSANFSSADGRWTVIARDHDTDSPVRFTSRFLFLGTGYYDYDAGFTPDFPGVGDFAGTIVHPQHWPQDLDYTGKRVVVIGSGATAITLIPAMTDRADHVTMLQRSPSYVLTLPSEDPIANALGRVLGPDRAYPIVRRKNVWVNRAIFKASMRAPTLTGRLLIANVRRQLPKHFDVDTHFTPTYNPWEQRLCISPAGDIFKAISDGRASVVTDRISRFTETGIALESGAELPADIIVTATGLNLSPLGKIEFSVDGEHVDVPDATVYKSMMLSGVPNLVFAMGYTNIAWTLRVDLVCEHFCRLLDHMDAYGLDTVVPVLDGPNEDPGPLLDLTSGYVKRGIGQFPKSGSSDPWTVTHAYEKDVERLRNGPVFDPALTFTSSTRTVAAPSPR